MVSANDRILVINLHLIIKITMVHCKTFENRKRYEEQNNTHS